MVDLFVRLRVHPAAIAGQWKETINSNLNRDGLVVAAVNGVEQIFRENVRLQLHSQICWINN